MTVISTIPLAGQPERFGITLKNTAYVLRFNFNDAAEGGWILDILDQHETPIVCGIPLITGVNLLGQYGYLGIGGFDSGLYVKTTDNEPPSYSNISDCRLMFVEGA